MSAHENDLDLFDDPDAPPTAEELAAAAALAKALEAPASSTEARMADAQLASALRAAHAPGDLPASRYDQLVAKAIEHAGPRKALPPSNVLAFRRKLYAAATIFAAAACLVLVLGRMGGRVSEDAPAPAAQRAADQASSEAQALALRRSTQPLFSEPFEREGGSSARIDTIALARSKDLRENRFARWGVR